MRRNFLPHTFFFVKNYNHKEITANDIHFFNVRDFFYIFELKIKIEEFLRDANNFFMVVDFSMEDIFMLLICKKRKVIKIYKQP